MVGLELFLPGRNPAILAQGALPPGSCRRLPPGVRAAPTGVPHHPPLRASFAAVLHGDRSAAVLIDRAIAGALNTDDPAEIAEVMAALEFLAGQRIPSARSGVVSEVLTHDPER
ncbi:MAG TPA: hypothetical protein VMU89_08085 [Thermomicrobiaceae bacterium]|nr:hypothetical protein [Thermomicrobiaceae bacterium]